MTFKDLIKRVKPEDKAGIYITVIFHLTVIIVLLAVQFTSMVRGENSFLLDFSRQEEIEQRAKEEEFKEDISRKIDEMLGSVPVSRQEQDVRNIAVDHSSQTLKDDRGTDAEKLYEDAERLRRELSEGNRQAIEEDARNEAVDLSPTKKEEKGKEYKGPSVVSYSLDGRKASHLSIPAYRCMGSGDVTVIIAVDPQGNVLNAKIHEEISSQDKCLRDFAVRAARLSKFSKSPTAPARQNGEIVYRFIAQ
ncbi:MAG: energy transducer TonB [Candidatus Cryptobacteroides sp.]